MAFPRPPQPHSVKSGSLVATTGTSNTRRIEESEECKPHSSLLGAAPEAKVAFPWPPQQHFVNSGSLAATTGTFRPAESPDGPMRSVGERRPSTEDGSQAQDHDQDATEARAMPKPLDPVWRGRARGHPGIRVRKEEIKPKDLDWTDIGSGMVAKTFVGATRMWTTTRGGPKLADIQSRKIWSLSTGRLLDECEIDRTPDRLLTRELSEPDDIRVELVLKGAQELYRRKHPAVAELYSQPRVCQEAATQRFGNAILKPGWSLDLTTKDPSTGKPWDLSDRGVQRKVKQLVRDTCLLYTSPSPRD